MDLFQGLNSMAIIHLKAKKFWGSWYVRRSVGHKGLKFVSGKRAEYLLINEYVFAVVKNK